MNAGHSIYPWIQPLLNYYLLDFFMLSVKKSSIYSFWLCVCGFSSWHFLSSIKRPFFHIFFYENLSPLFAIIHTLYRRKILKKTKMKKGTLESLFSEILWKKKLLINYSGYWLEQGCKTKVFYRRALLNLLLLMRGNKYGQ